MYDLNYFVMYNIDYFGNELCLILFSMFEISTYIFVFSKIFFSNNSATDLILVFLRVLVLSFAVLYFVSVPQSGRIFA